MGKRLTSMSWDDMRAEMSLTGSPEKIAELGDKIMKMIEETLDSKNPMEVYNMDFALRRIRAELKLWFKIMEKRSGGQEWKL